MGYKDVNLGSQKSFAKTIHKLKSGEKLNVVFYNGGTPKLVNDDNQDVLLFSKSFRETKYSTFTKDGYTLTSAKVEYLVFWYDAEEDKEYEVVLPKLVMRRIIG